MVFAYDGSNYHGFQSQKDKNTIEKAVLEALFKIDKSINKIIASGRTDKGVHALGQVIHFDSVLNIEPKKFSKAIQTYLPKDILIKALEVVDDNFHARHQALKKTYEYIITTKYDVFLRNYQSFVYYQLDLDLMEKATYKFVGTHDFFGFASYIQGKPTVKTIFSANFVAKDDKIIITFTGNGFLKYMVRRIVGTIIEIGAKRKDIKVIDEIFTTKSPKLCGKTASPNGLYLKQVIYKEE